LGNSASDRRVRQSRRDDCELVAAEPRHHLIFVKQVGDAVRNRLQERIASRMTEEIVDLLEAVKVEAEDRQTLAGGQCRGYLKIELLVEARAVRQPGQGVVMGHETDMLFGLLA